METEEQKHTKLHKNMDGYAQNRETNTQTVSVRAEVADLVLKCPHTLPNLETHTHHTQG